MQFPATPGWGPRVVVVCCSPPLLAGACRLWWCLSRPGVSLVVCVCGVCGCARWPCCVVCCVFVVSALLVVWCGGAVGVSSACAGVRGCLCVVCRWFAVWCPRPLPLLAVGLGGGAPPLLAEVRRRVPWSVPRHSWPSAVGVVPRHSWLGSTGCGGGCPGCPSPWFWCVCVCCVALRVGVGGVGGVVRGVAAVCVRVCACGVWLVGCVIPWLVLVVGRHGCVQKAEEEVL